MKRNMSFLHPALFIIFNLAFINGGWSKELIYEDGYTVTTVFDGNKLKINPHSILPHYTSGSHNLILLDSSNGLFYTLSLPLSQESEVKRFAGKGGVGFSDGDSDSALFDKPQNFAMDFKGNVYVADRKNFAIRKISDSGVTTIAGGFSTKAGHSDGPGRNATFSADYELTFVNDMCALLILDHGHQLIRQINLKQEDCERSESGVGVTAVWPWVVALVVSCLMGMLIGFAIRHYAPLHEDFNLNKISKSWTSYLMNLVRHTRMLCYGTRSAVPSPALKFLKGVVLLVLSHICLMLSFRIKRVDSSYSALDKNSVSLLDSVDSCSSECLITSKYNDQLRDLISFDEDPGSSIVRDGILKQEVPKNDGDHQGQIHELMLANITNFADGACKSAGLEEPQFLGVSTLVKRK